jgi:hypothetical protein
VLSSSKTSRINPDDADGRGGGRMESLPPPRSGRGGASERASDAPPRYDSLEIKCRGGEGVKYSKDGAPFLRRRTRNIVRGGKGEEIDGRDHTSARSKVKTDRYRVCDDDTTCKQFYPRSSVHRDTKCSLCFLLRSQVLRPRPFGGIRIPLGFKDISSPSQEDESGAIGRPDISPPRPTRDEKKKAREKGAGIV